MNEHEINTLILCENITAKEAHRELFGYNDSCYAILGIESIKEELTRLNRFKNIDSLHICVSWVTLLELATRGSVMNRFNITELMKRAGLNEEEREIIKDFGINDIFPWLYYGKKFRVLRKLCNITKDNIKREMNLKLEIHLISEDIKQIVASTL